MKRYLLIFLLTVSTLVSAQDERFYRRIFTNELVDKPSAAEDYKIVVKSPIYQINIDSDKELEGIRVIKKDGLDFIEILSEFGERLFEAKLVGIGKESSLFKIQLKGISKDTNTLILHFYEGKIDSTKFEASARLYFLTYKKNNLKKINMFKGPHFFHEKEKVNEQYWNRRFSVNTIDYNKDGVKEISISYNKINRVYFYLESGTWGRM